MAHLPQEQLLPWLLGSLGFAQTTNQPRPALELARLLASDGFALPPLCFLADFITLATGQDRGQKPALPQRDYADNVLGKLALDGTFERVADALRRYSPTEKPRALAYAVKKLLENMGFVGQEVPPPLLLNLKDRAVERVWKEALQAASEPLPELLADMQRLMSAFRRTGELFAPEDILALEQKTALAELGQYVAHRQLAQALSWYLQHLPQRPVRPAPGRREIPTRIRDEDQYPVGGYSSISNRGSIESLLHSQLAYMEDDHRPDLFDMKFLRDELFFYSRDENQFLRTSRAFVVVLPAELTVLRHKDKDLQFQRIILLQGMILSLFQRLTDWLSDHSLHFVLVFPQLNNKDPLQHEIELFEVFLRDAITHKTATILKPTSMQNWELELTEIARDHQTHVLMVNLKEEFFEIQNVVFTQLLVNNPSPLLIDGHGVEVPLAADDAPTAWLAATEAVLALWA